jgi:hypothetical protein
MAVGRLRPATEPTACRTSSKGALRRRAQPSELSGARLTFVPPPRAWMWTPAPARGPAPPPPQAVGAVDGSEPTVAPTALEEAEGGLLAARNAPEPSMASNRAASRARDHRRWRSRVGMAAGGRRSSGQVPASLPHSAEWAAVASRVAVVATAPGEPSSLQGVDPGGPLQRAPARLRGDRRPRFPRLQQPAGATAMLPWSHRGARAPVPFPERLRRRSRRWPSPMEIQSSLP